jgi:hypothetical protein
MRGIRQSLISAAVLAGTAVAVAQTPAPLPVPVSEPAIAAALPGGTVVGSHGSPVAAVPMLATAEPATPSAATPPVAAPLATSDVLLSPTPNAVPQRHPMLGGQTITPPPVNGNCCGPIGGNGPIGQELYFRVGAAFALGNNALAKPLNAGWNAQIGGRSQFFDPTGDAAWVVDGHLSFTWNDAGPGDVVTFNDEPVTVRALRRWAVGVGFGRDSFFNAPGFVAGTWDANFRFGWDLGARWGSGSVDLNPIFEENGYRRHQDVFAQTYAGLMATMEMPVGAWTALAGGRLEWNYTFSDILPKGGSFHEIVVQFEVGVRY